MPYSPPPCSTSARSPSGRRRTRCAPPATRCAEVLLERERDAVVATCRRMVADGLVVGTAGNVSARDGELVAVTPTAVPYDALSPAQVGVFRLDGAPVDAPL